MNIEKLDNLFFQYGYIPKEKTEKVRVFVLNQGMYHGAEVISLDGSEQESIVSRYSRLGYSTFVQHFSNEDEAEQYLFKGFFNTQTTESEIYRRYNEFAHNQVKHYGNSDIKYEYISMPYNISKDTHDNQSAGESNVVPAILEELDKKGAHLVIVEAAAGFGKTCTAYELYYSFRTKVDRVKPIFAELYKNRDAKQFKYILWDEIDKEKDTNAKQDLVVYNIKKGRIPLIIDGFDELLSKDIDQGKTDQPNEFEQVETMLSTIGDLLKGEAKIILTTRKTAIFTGAEFSEWVDSYNGAFDVVRFQLDKPNIREWLSSERFDAIQSKRIPLTSISNPVLLTYLRNISINEFNSLLENPESLTSKYFEHLLNREKERQFISIRWEDQMVLFENLAHAFAQFDITGESRSFVKELLIEYNKPQLLYFRESMTTKQTLEELADTLTNHALLDRASNKDSISFVNEFVFGYLLGMSLLKDSDFLTSQEPFPEYLIELAIFSFRYSSDKDKHDLWDILSTVQDRMGCTLSIETDAYLLGKLCHNIEYEGITSMYFENIYFVASECIIKETSFVDSIFEKCILDRSVFQNVTFTGCRFVDCKVINTEVILDSTMIHCFGCEDFKSGFLNSFVSKPLCEAIPESEQNNLEKEILGKYFKVDGRTPKMRYISSLRKDFEGRNIDEVFDVFERLRKCGYIVVSGNNSHIRQEGMTYYHKKFNNER